MTALFSINQPGTPLLPAGRARGDLFPFSVGGVITLAAADITHHDYTWEVIGKPIDGLAPVVVPAFTTCTLQLEERGGYLIRLTVDAGLVTEDVSILYAGLPLATSGLPLPSVYETNFDNSITPFDGSQGWWYKLERWIKWMEAHGGGGGLGDLPQTQTVYVDGGRTDVYIETGTFGFPFKTIQPAINLAQTLADAVGGEACVHIRPWQYTEPNVVLPSNVHIDAEMGASLIPTIPSHGLVVVPGNFRTQLGVTIVRGLSFAGNGGGAWPPVPDIFWGLYLPVSVPPLGMDPPVVFPVDCGIGALQNACGICVEQGAVYLTDAGGMFSDLPGGTNAIAVRVGPPGGGPPMFGAIAMIGMFNLSASETMFDILPGGAVLATGTKLDNNTGILSDAVVRINGGALPGLGAVFIGKNLRLDGDSSSMVKETGNAFVLLDSSAGNFPTMGNFVGDIFDIRQGFLSLAGGAYRTNNGNGLMLRAIDGSVSCWTRDTDIIADKGLDDVQVLITEATDPTLPLKTLNLQTYNTRFRGERQVDGRTYARFNHPNTNSWAFIDGGIIEGSSLGGVPATTADIVGGLTWFTGGLDVNAAWNDIALHVNPSAILLHGHSNVRAGQVVVDPGGWDVPLTSSFGNLQFGKYDSIIKAASRVTLAEMVGEPDCPHGSIAVITGGPKPLIYINYGTDVARDWRLLTDYVRIQVTGAPPIDLSLAPLTPIPWNTEVYDDDPPYDFTPTDTVIKLTEAGDYRLSFHLAFQNSAFMAFGTSVVAYWQYSTNFGVTWTDISQTISFDSTPNVLNPYGAVDLAPYEVFLPDDSWLRVVVGLAGIPIGPVILNVGGDWSWARVEKGGVGASGGTGGSDWTVEVVNADRVLTSADHKKNFLVTVTAPATINVTLPATPFIGQEIRIAHSGPGGPLAGRVAVLKDNPADIIGMVDAPYDVLASDVAGSVTHLVCVDDGSGYIGTKVWGDVNGTGIWFDAVNIGAHVVPPFNANEFFQVFVSPFMNGSGGPSSIKQNEATCDAKALFSFAFGIYTEANAIGSFAFGKQAQANWEGEEVWATGGFNPPPAIGEAQRSTINLYGETTDMGPALGDLSPEGLNAIPLTVTDYRVYACEVLLVAAQSPYFPMLPFAAAWKLQFLVHGGAPGMPAFIVGTKNKLLFSRDPNPIIDPWDVDVTIGGPGPVPKDIKITVTQGVAPGSVRWDAVLNMAQVMTIDVPT